MIPQQKYPLATKTGIEMMITMLIVSGAMCHKCGYGTKKTSKRWARCKRCGERVEIKEVLKGEVK